MYILYQKRIYFNLDLSEISKKYRFVQSYVRFLFASNWIS